MPYEVNNVMVGGCGDHSDMTKNEETHSADLADKLGHINEGDERGVFLPAIILSKLSEEGCHVNRRSC